MNFSIKKEDSNKKKEIEEDEISLLTMNNDENKDALSVQSESEQLSIANVPKNQDVLFFSVTESFRFLSPSDVKVHKLLSFILVPAWNVHFVSFIRLVAYLLNSPILLHLLTTGSYSIMATTLCFISCIFCSFTCMYACLS